MTPAAWIGLAACGALGAVARFRVDGAVSDRSASDFPAGTLVVNLTGAFLLGLVAGAAVSPEAAFVIGTGFMGGYTTFSTWMVETERLAELGELAGVLVNLWLSMLAGLGVAALGWYVGHTLL